MLRLLTSEQTRQADKYTIEHRSIASIDLMEAASTAFTHAFITHYPDPTQFIAVYCGTGNNGGDGLAVARLLKEKGFEKIQVVIARFSGKETEDFTANLERLKETRIEITELKSGENLSTIGCDIIIDALLGSGINKPLEGDWKKVAEHINRSNATVVSVDIPTGFPPEGIIDKDHTFVNADLTVTFQRPKLNFLLPECAKALKEFKVVEIGLNENFIQSVDSPYFFLTEKDIAEKLKKRERFSHKGTFGHALIIAGQAETAGAALLCAEACLNAGAGLTTTCIPSSLSVALNARCPEVMALFRENDLPEIDLMKYNSIAVGSGLGTAPESVAMVQTIVSNYRKPTVFDADALNILSKTRELLYTLPAGSVLTPHVKEFDRLFGEHDSWWMRLETGKEKAQELKAVIILKNRYTIIFTPKGEIIFNPTGHPAMASGGMGDTLTGIIVSFLAQGYNSSDAAILGVYLHGKTGENLAKQGFYVVRAGKIIEKISETIGSFTA